MQRQEVAGGRRELGVRITPTRPAPPPTEEKHGGCASGAASGYTGSAGARCSRPPGRPFDAGNAAAVRGGHDQLRRSREARRPIDAIDRTRFPSDAGGVLPSYHRLMRPIVASVLLAVLVGGCGGTAKPSAGHPFRSPIRAAQVRSASTRLAAARQGRAAPPCRPNVSYVGSQQATGDVFALFEFRNDTRRYCRVSRFPYIRLLPRDGRSFSSAEHEGPNPALSPISELGAGKTGAFNLDFRPRNGSGTRRCFPAAYADIQVSSFPSVRIVLPAAMPTRSTAPTKLRLPINPCYPFEVSPITQAP